jgi:hypothetical protein
MRILATALLATVAYSSLCHASEPVPTSPGEPSHITVVPATPLVRRNVVGVVGHPTIFTFPDNEQIYRAPQMAKPDKDGALTDAKWEGPDPKDAKETPLGNNLPLWPVVSGETTMTIITMTADGKQKVYPLHLSALPDNQEALTRTDVTLNMVYRGGPASAAPVPAAAPVMPSTGPAPISAPVMQVRWTRTRQQRQEAEDRLRTDSFNGADNACHYHAQGQKPNTISPLCPMDNGMWTLIRFPGLTQKPAVYSVNDDNSDGRLMRQHGTADFVVLEEIAPRFRLRLGDVVLDIVNDAYDAVGKPTNTGTISPNVVRELVPARAVAAR